MKPVADLPKLESSTIAPAAANDATHGVLFLDMLEDGNFALLIDESSARDLYHELAMFLGYED